MSVFNTILFHSLMVPHLKFDCSNHEQMMVGMLSTPYGQREYVFCARKKYLLYMSTVIVFIAHLYLQPVEVT